VDRDRIQLGHPLCEQFADAAADILQVRVRCVAIAITLATVQRVAIDVPAVEHHAPLGAGPPNKLGHDGASLVPVKHGKVRADEHDVQRTAGDMLA